MASAVHAAINVRQSTGVPPTGPLPLKAPRVPVSSRWIIHAARSRMSMNCSGLSSGTPGTSIAPPSAVRQTQWLKRPVGSPGPTISPGRTISARAPNTRKTSASQAAFCGP